MAGERVSIEFVNAGYKFGAYRIEVNITDQLEQIGILLTQYGFAAVLKKPSAAAMPAVKAHCITG